MQEEAVIVEGHPLSLQIIGHDGHFNPQLPEFMVQNGLVRSGLKYGVVSIIGGQGSGKSTILNHLFGTRFDTMHPEEGRTQTTQGIWAAKAADLNIFVLDVEGTDGRESWEDQKAFENKSALLSLALTDVLMVNLWEKEVGRFTAANLPLLKTVFEVHLRLFSKGCSEKPLLLFIIRDCDGRTPEAKLAATINSDMARIWKEITKPEEAEQSEVSDYFEIRAVPLPHYVHQLPQWEAKAGELRSTFTDPGSAQYVFADRDQKAVPADGFADYAKQLWDTIESEGDLDLPSQRKMLSQFRCRSKVADGVKAFKEGHDDLLAAPSAQSSSDVETANECGSRFASKAKEAVKLASDTFLKESAGYDPEVRNEEVASLRTQLWQVLLPAFEQHAVVAAESRKVAFSLSVARYLASDKGCDKDEGLAVRFCRWVRNEQEGTVQAFDEQLRILAPEGSGWSAGTVRKGLVTDLAQRAAREKDKLARDLLESVKKALLRRIGSELSVILDEAALDMWASITEMRSAALAAAVDSLSNAMEALESNNSSVDSLPAFATECVHDRIAEKARERSVADTVFRRFDNMFNREKTREWRSWDNVQAEHNSARQTALSVLDLFVQSKLPDLDAPHVFLSDDTVQEMKEAFNLRANAELGWAEARKAEAATRNVWVLAGWGLAILLGLDNFLWLLNHPFYFLLFLLACGAAGAMYLQHKLGSYGAVGNLVIVQLTSALANAFSPPAAAGPSGGAPGAAAGSLPVPSSRPSSAASDRPKSL
eukprot:CAMPEP_0114548794 /NCGR_PEP_ID=MMETSP0114-20121206/5178_1 /TAXON_ID=31324 /ORGANISM="Goniomonas sp, Strain m" /LENGTH=765 /DNA_ID=CAMNT_0001733421 /DNA_START=15 /DNA_END=2312 /DNA_ORIENTATION=+